MPVTRLGDRLLDPGSTLDVLRRARTQIVSNPDAFEFMDFCHCLAGHVYQAATGKPYDNPERADTGLHIDTPLSLETPFGAAAAAIVAANPHYARGTLSAQSISGINAGLTSAVPYGLDGTPYRAAAVLALDNAIAEESF